MIAEGGPHRRRRARGGASFLVSRAPGPREAREHLGSRRYGLRVYVLVRVQPTGDIADTCTACRARSATAASFDLRPSFVLPFEIE